MSISSIVTSLLSSDCKNLLNALGGVLLSGLPLLSDGASVLSGDGVGSGVGLLLSSGLGVGSGVGSSVGSGVGS